MEIRLVILVDVSQRVGLGHTITRQLLHAKIVAEDSSRHWEPNQEFESVGCFGQDSSELDALLIRDSTNCICKWEDKVTVELMQHKRKQKIQSSYFSTEPFFGIFRCVFLERRILKLLLQFIQLHLQLH